MKSTSRLAFLSLAALLALACGGERRSSTGTTGSAGGNRPISVKGSDTMVIMTQRLAEEYMKAKPGTVVQVNGGGSGTGLAAMINGTTDLAQSSRPMKDSEREKIEQGRGAKVVETPIALDALGVFVHESNPVKELTVSQVRDIYMGVVKNWSEVGDGSSPIILYGRESSSGTYDYFKEHVLEKKDFAPAVQTLQGTAAIMNAVAQDPNAIGYGGIAYAKGVKALPLRAEGASAAIAPTEATVADGSYPLSRSLFFYSTDNSPAGVKEFVDWCLTPEAQALVTRVGYFPIRNTAASPAVTTTDVQSTP